MTATTIEVAFANPPKDGKKQGTVKTKDGQLLGVWPDKLGLLRPGNSYQVEVSEREWNGRVFKTITKVTPQAATKQDNAPAATPQDHEFEFVARVLPAMVAACMVGREQADITGAARMLRKVYREAFS